jgi:hypothetical protein
MPESSESVDRAREGLLHLRDVDGRGDVIERLGALFPGFGADWLTSQSDHSFGAAFGTEQDAGGWLDSEQYAEFWGYLREYEQGGDLGPVADFLERLLTVWESALAEQPPAYAEPEVEHEPRYTHIGPVPGLPDWWQGFDTQGQEWRYVHSEAAPSDDSAHWMAYADAFPQPPVPLGQTAPVEADEAVPPGHLSDWPGPGLVLQDPAIVLKPGEDRLLPADRIQTGHVDKPQKPFRDVKLGNRADRSNTYLWTLDERGLNIVPASTEVIRNPRPASMADLVAQPVKHTNVSARAAIGGEAWFGPDNTVVIDANSGRFGESPDGTGATRTDFTEDEWATAVQRWADLGYTVVPTLPYFGSTDR